MQEPESYAVYDAAKKMTSYYGPKADEAVRLVALATALRCFSIGMTVTGQNKSAVLRQASEEMGRKYTKEEIIVARRDLLKKANDIKASLPLREQ